MSARTSEQVSSQERQAISVDVQSLGQDTQAFRAEAYRLRTAGSLDVTTNERLRAQQLELERRGESLIKRLSPELDWNTGGSASSNSGVASQIMPLATQSQLASSNSLQLQGT